ncbi:hypothetical protein ECANGB1_897 [Enterospora canceri]|uniref:Homologous-pairing protein 2 winged helix domain-containing protein n=1 Tax=Enterospora canceri TaxID=1081671 RepID=A0A1Y1S8D1_9MICR|nr:hypothetical protein ECANGB1_897 [Enterospora canceri]
MTSLENTEPKKTKRAKKVVLKSEDYKTLRNQVYTLFYYSNKPFILTELNLQFKEARKTEIETICDDLTSKGLLTNKMNGKTKIWYLNQNKLNYGEKENLASTAGSMDARKQSGVSMGELEEVYEEVKEEFKITKEKGMELRNEINSLNNELSNVELEDEIEKMKVFITENKAYENVELVDEEEYKKHKTVQVKYRKMEAERKGILKNIINSVSEGMGKSKKEFMEEVGISKE